MSTVATRRPPRLVVPDPGTSVIELATPPRQSESPAMSGSMGMILVPAASGVGAVLVAVTHQDRPLMAAAGLLVLAASIAVGLAMVIGSRTGARRRTREQRERYLDYLEQIRGTVRQATDAQRLRSDLLHPDPRDAAGAAFQDHRRWERRPGDPDFLQLRIGLGAVPPARTVTVSVDANDPLVAYDPVCLAAARDLASGVSALAEQPICADLAPATLTCVIGDPHRVLGVARAMLAQLTWAHSPSDVAVLVCGSEDSGHWDWLKWLPHARSIDRHDGPVPARLISSNPLEALEQLTDEAAGFAVGIGNGTARRFVVVMDRTSGSPPSPHDDATLRAGALTVGAHVLCLLRTGDDEPDRVNIRVTVASGTGPGTDPDCCNNIPCRVDRLDETGVIELARAFAPLRPNTERPNTERPITERAIRQGQIARGRVAQGSNEDDQRRAHPIGDVTAIDPARRWRSPELAALLRAPIGTAEDGRPVVLDLKESARGGSGPHGLIVGATGSGKSELLRTLVIALAIRHSPQTLALLLADFKGGATFSGLATLPHVAGMITNLESEEGLVDRFRDALGGELHRRQEIFAAAGRLTSLDAYNERRRREPGLEAMPHLLVIVDEFSELLGARPDLADLFVTVGRIGRSIGIHLLLATQRLDTGRIRGLESHLSYRICLRTFSEGESREAIGSPDAHHLPTEPGWAYLLADGPVPRRFRVAMVSRTQRAPAPPPAPSTMVLPFHALNGVAGRALELVGNRDAAHRPGSPAARDATQPGTGSRNPPPWSAATDRTLLDIAVDRVCTGARVHPAGRPARRIWLEPLPSRLTLSDLADRSGGQRPAGQVCAQLGVVDVPERQRQDVLEWDFTAGNANLLIVGAGRTGKSTAVATLVASLCQRHAPGDIEVLCVDFGGGTLTPWAQLPHVAAVGSRSEPELTTRILTRLTDMLTEREALFRRHRLASTTELRQARRSGTVDPSTPGDVVLIIDGWAGVRDAAPEFDAAVTEIVSRGTGLGIHTILTVLSPQHLRGRLTGSFGQRIELRLGDSFDSGIDRTMAKSLPGNIPGRALVAGPHVAQLALPVFGTTAGTDPSGSDVGSTSTDNTTSHTRTVLSDSVIAAIRERWPDRQVSRIRTLPTLVSLADLSVRSATDRRGEHSEMRPGSADATRPGLILGLGEDHPEPIRHDFLADEPHLVIYGDARTGKSTLLRSVVAQLTCSSTVPEVLVVDHRQRLSLLASSDRLRVLATSGETAVACAQLAHTLAQRVVTDHHEPIYLLVDDYDLVATGSGNPLVALLAVLARARDTGFHLILTRRIGGAARAQYEPVLQTLGDLGTPVVMLSGAASEGRLAHGIAPVPLPPGRARFVTRGHPPQLIQTPWVPPFHPLSDPNDGAVAAG